jgi:hypothetical protein
MFVEPDINGFSLHYKLSECNSKISKCYHLNVQSNRIIFMYTYLHPYIHALFYLFRLVELLKVKPSTYLPIYLSTSRRVDR